MTETKSLTLRDKYLGKDLADELTAPTPSDIVDERKIRGGGTVKYVAGPHFIRKLNNCFGFLWSYEVPKSFELNGQIVATGRLTVHMPVPKKKVIKRYIENGKQVEEETMEWDILGLVKEQFGSSEIKRWSSTEYSKDKAGNTQKDAEGKYIFKHKAGEPIDLGDDYKGAGTDAMKKCATQFGIFLDVYESRAGEEEGVVTKKQLEVFYWRAKEAGMDETKANKWGEEQIGKPINEWDPLDAMQLIPKLIDMAENKEKE